MSLGDRLEDWKKNREARTHHERHGSGEITFFNEMPIRATGCRLPDGSLADAECLLPYVAVPDEALRVWTRRLPGTPFRRRGRLTIDPGKAVFFVDDANADLSLGLAECGKAVEPDLERDLGLSGRIRDLLRSELFATLLYGSLCNTTWRHRATGTLWGCSWRHAGGIVAELRCEGSYLDWYCSTGEGLVDDQVLAEIEALGWGLAEAAPPES